MSSKIPPPNPISREVHVALILFAVVLVFGLVFSDFLERSSRRHLQSVSNPDRADLIDAQKKIKMQQIISINQADFKMLQRLPGIGPEMAKRIIAYREEKGPFETPQDLLKVSGIGPITLEEIRQKIQF
jgi:comEA protein